MSVFKLGASMRCMSPQKFPSSFVGTSRCTAQCDADHPACRNNGTLSSLFTRQINNNADKGEKGTIKDKIHEEKNLTDTTDTSHVEKDGIISAVEKDPKEVEIKNRLKVGFSSFGINVPLKIAELNKYLSSTSKKLITITMSVSQNSNNNMSQNNDAKSSSKNFSPSNPSISSQEKTHPLSFENSVHEMNQSIVSFYDTTCANESHISVRPHSLPSNQYSTNTQEPQDEDLGSIAGPQTIGPLFPMKATEAKKKKAAERRAEKISRLSLESRTKSLVQSLKSAHSLMSKVTRIEELCEHLISHPECVWDACSEQVVPCLLRLSHSQDRMLKGLAHEALALVGYAKPLTSPGIRVLSIDGGGTRGLVTIEFLKALERETGMKTYQLFDYVIGVSTGALLACMVCLYKLPLERCEALYKDCAVKMFTRNRVVGTTKLVWKHGFYDSQSWEEILKKEMGEKPYVEFSRDPDIPRSSAVSSLVSAPRMTNHLFRTYNPPPGTTSVYPGNCKHRIWEVIRASSAAPGYFESFSLGDDVHEDGGILTNNPTAVAIHESRLLWPKENFHCVVSLGTGRFEGSGEPPSKYSLRKRISTIVDSATDTEAAHHTLQDLLPARSYFRFNPYLSEEFFLDEIRIDKMAQMQHDAQMYTRRNNYKLQAVSERLMQRRKPQQVVGDWMKTLVDKV